MYEIPESETLQRAGSRNTPPNQVVQRAQQGDELAFTELFMFFNAPICTYLTRMVGNPEQGRDLAQETFLQAWKSLAKLDGDLHFRSWLYRIATNVAYSHMRRAYLRRWIPWTKNGQELAYAEPNTLGPETWIGEAEQVQQVLSRLSPQYKACLLLKLVGGFTQREIATMLGISEKTVSTNVFRGREQFKKLYQHLEGDKR